MSTFLGLFPLLIVSVNKPISYSTYRQSFKKSFRDIVPDITNFSTHSARSGGATSAANPGIPERHFQRHGRWASVSAKNTYIKDSLASRLDVSKSLSLKLKPFLLSLSGAWLAHAPIYEHCCLVCTG